jgi:hypothetical protein
LTEVGSTAPGGVRIQQASDEVYRVLAGEDNRSPAEMPFSTAEDEWDDLLLAHPRRRFGAFAIAVATILSFSFGAVVALLFEEASDDRTIVDATATLKQERQIAAALTAELTTARRDFEAQLALSGDALRQATEFERMTQDVAAQLEQERLKTAELMRIVDGAQPEVHPPAASEGDAKGQSIEARTTVAAAEQPVTSGTKNVDPDAADRLIARANGLLAQGNISAARIVLERAVEMGSARASFSIAETYNQSVLSGWNTYGTRGDASKARDFYEKAAAGGVEEAKDRLDALRE